jgi:cellulose synthase/poly-beta-1,6-N-acetylglucosamine synthase-like glycosyltransferase
MSWSYIVHLIFTFFLFGIFVYAIFLMVSYLGISLYSIGETDKYIHKNVFTDFSVLASTSYAPTLSIIAPAYNEGKGIVENVRSLLAIYYSSLEVIVVNDGSKDDSLKILISAYELEKIDYFIHYQIPTQEIRGIYKSKNPLYNKLIIVDKENGGKSDALNAGINVSNNNYIVCIDADCVLEQDAMLKMVKPFLEQTDVRVIASGGVLRIANSCIVENGRLVKVIMQKEYLPRMQSLEYIRAFILGRMGWSRLNGLLLISGAFGVFDKEIVIKCGGYSTQTVGEDMELVVRMRRYLEEQKMKYKVVYIPDPLCWTEAPNSFKILGRQRNRWARGLYETLRMHKSMFFNPKYRLLGMLSYPFWFFFELGGPLVEFFGFIFFIVFALTGMIDWGFSLLLLLFVIFFAYTYSAFAIYMDVYTDKEYKKRKDVLQLILTSFTEPFYFHPFIVVSTIRGYFDLFRKKKSWGEMTREGFTQTTSAPAINPSTTVNAREIS